MPEIFGFTCPSCGESLGAELPAMKMVITCTACGLDFAVKRPAKGKDEAEEAEEQGGGGGCNARRGLCA